MKIINVDVWGCCTSRDIFGIGSEEGGENYGNFISYNNEMKDIEVHVRKYFEQCSIISAFNKRNGPLLTIDEFNNYAESQRHFIKKMTLADYNREVIPALNETDSEWIIIDLRSLTYGLTEIIYENGKSDYICQLNKKYITHFLTSHNIQYKTIDYYGCEIDYIPYLDKMIEFIKKRYGDKVILIDVREPEYAVDELGIIVKLDTNYKNLQT